MKGYLQSHRALAYVLLFLTACVCVSRLAPFAQPGGSAAPSVPVEDWVVAAVSDVFEVKPSEVSLRPATPLGERTRFDVALGKGREPLRVSCDPKNRSIIMMRRGARREGGPDIGLAKAREMGLSIATRRFPKEADHLKPTCASLIPVGLYDVAWRVEPEPWVTTGDGVGVMFTRAGEISSYGEHGAPRRLTVADTRVTREQAERAALGIAQGREHEKATWTLDYALLVLSSPMSKDQGPVWQVAFKRAVPGTGKHLMGIVIFLDAVSGKELTGH